VASRLNRPLDPRLALRRRDTRPQVGLAVADRRSNLAGAFAASPAVCGLRVALLDDVTTTGRTLQELAAVLLEAGAESVDGWCVAHADRRDLRSAEASGRSPTGDRMR
jgi:predicted amidophosphoribosyltransferase